jgi:ATP-dependent RNA helicase RhlE
MSETNQLRDIQAGAEVVIATPGRLCDYLDRRLVDLSGTAATQRAEGSPTTMRTV